MPDAADAHDLFFVINPVAWDHVHLVEKVSLRRLYFSQPASRLTVVVLSQQRRYAERKKFCAPCSSCKILASRVIRAVRYAIIVLACCVPRAMFLSYVLRSRVVALVDLCSLLCVSCNNNNDDDNDDVALELYLLSSGLTSNVTATSCENVSLYSVLRV